MEEVIKKIKESKKILITTHENPDGDGIGAGLALFLAINDINKDGEKTIRFIIQDPVPEFLKFLGHSLVIEESKNVDSDYKFDLVICVDSADVERIGDVKKYIRDDNFVINLDHHVSNTKYGDINIVRSDLSSASELIYLLIEKIGIKLDKDMAESVYCGIVNDTGNFSYNNVSEKTFEISAKLKRVGIDNEKISASLFSNKSEARLKILGKALFEMEFNEEKKLAYFFLEKAYMDSLNAKREDAEGVVEALRSYEKAEVSLFLREETDGKLKGSLRSKEKDVNEIAAIFGGGGHIKAAGFKTELSKEEIVQLVLKKL